MAEQISAIARPVRIVKTEHSSQPQSTTDGPPVESMLPHVVESDESTATDVLHEGGAGASVS